MYIISSKNDMKISYIYYSPTKNEIEIPYVYYIVL